jgi:hypothetical protein
LFSFLRQYAFPKSFSEQHPNMSAVQRTSDKGVELDRAGGAGEWRLSHSCAGVVVS